jgi:ribosomal protein S15P/S13E
LDIFQEPTACATLPSASTSPTIKTPSVSTDTKADSARLEAELRNLEDQLAKANRELKSAKAEIVLAHNKISNLEKQNKIERDIERSYFAAKIEKQGQELIGQHKAKCEDLIEQHKAECEGLINQHEETVRELKETLATPKQVKRFGIKIHGLRNENEELREEKNQLRENAELLEGQISGLEVQIERQESLIENEVMPEIERLKAKQADCKSQSITQAVGTGITKTVFTPQQVANLVARIEELESELDEQKPLLDIGIAVRLRFLEQNRHKACEKVRGTNGLAQGRGNSAAHHGKGEADAALFRIGILKEGSDLSKVFQGLYEAGPEVYLEFPELLKRTIDAGVTMRTFKKLNPGSHTKDLRARRSEIEGKLFKAWDICTTLEDVENFQSKGSNLSMVKDLEWLTSEITNFDCKEMPKGKPRALVGRLSAREDDY